MTSTNKIVANAMAARRVALNWGPWKPGQRVQEENGTRTGTVVKQGGLNDLVVVVKWDNGATEEMHRFQLKALNAKRTARNAKSARAYADECEKFIAEAKSLIEQWRSFYQKMVEKRKWYDDTMEKLLDGVYRVNRDDPDFGKADAAFSELRRVMQLADRAHLFASVG